MTSQPIVATVGMWPPPAGRAYRVVKRSIDVVIASAVLLLGAPLWLLIAAAIRITSAGPALFRARVIGEQCRPFVYYKFRTMRAGDDAQHRGWLQDFVVADRPFAEVDGKPVYKVIDDPRITPIGRILRRVSLDEVPQLINVLRGEMSMVGPRPPLPAEFEHYDERARLRLAVPPGITGLYQVSARSQVPFSAMLALDLDYIARRSVALELQILARTLWAVVRGRGAA
jgi:lipopolysaccharide/colanic/teichoic acid biosynthesis glycosyltransferase